MNVINKSNLIFYWILVNTIAPAAGWLIGNYLALYFDGSGVFSPRTYVLSFTLAIAISLAQGLVLREWVDSRNWIFASTLSLTVCLPNSFVLCFIVAFSLSSLFLGCLAAGIFLGTLVGFFQWLILRKKYYQANVWFIATLIAYTINYLILAIYIINSLDNNIFEGTTTPILLAIYGLITGCITAISLEIILERNNNPY